MFRAAFTCRFNTNVVATHSALGALLSLLLSTICIADDKITSPDAGLLPLEELRTFTRVYDHVRNGYVDEIDDAQLLDLLAEFRATFDRVAALDCDLAVSAHPGPTALFERAAARDAGKPEPAFFNDQSCRDYAAFGRDWLDKRLAEEAAKPD